MEDKALCAYDETMGFRLVSADDDQVTLEHEVTPATRNPMGVLHGGVIAGLADSAMGHLMVRQLAPGERGTNMDLNLKFLRPTTEGRLRATSSIIRTGGRTWLVEAYVTDAEGRLVAKAESTFLRLD